MTYSSDEALPIGTVVHERYRTLAIVGRGGVGTVYQVADVLYGKNNTYALKELANQTTAARRQFDNEAQWLQALDHNNIPKVREYFEWESRLYLVMDFVDGENLEQKLARQGGRPLPEAQVVGWILPICDALQYLHSRQPPILHRDVKPANIIVTPAGHPVLVDLGIAKEHLPGAGQTATFVRKAGTEGYAPPEQYIAAGRTGPWSDVYGLGATLYELLTGAIPPTAVERVALDNPMLRPRAVNPNISPRIDDAVTRALAIRPADRFQTVAELTVALGGTPRPSAPVLGFGLGAGLSGGLSGGLNAGAGMGPITGPGLNPGLAPGMAGSGPSGTIWRSGPSSPPPSALSGGLGVLPPLDEPPPLPYIPPAGAFPDVSAPRPNLSPGLGVPVLPPPGMAPGMPPNMGPGSAQHSGATGPRGGVARAGQSGLLAASAPDLSETTRRADEVREGRRSRRRTWLAGSFIALVGLVVVVGVVAVLASGLLTPPDRSTPQATVSGYFGALAASDYTRAWQYWSASLNDVSSQPSFIGNLRSDDSRYGKVMHAQIVNVAQDSPGSARAQVEVQRADDPGTQVTSTVALTLYSGRTWLIDNISST
jgi:serine/threonine-protein kinase